MPFPFSDLSRSKYRPALLLADVGRRDWIACQITSNPYADARAIAIESSHFKEGGLTNMSYVRPDKLFTVHEDLIEPTAGTLKPGSINVAREAVINF